MASHNLEGPRKEETPPEAAGSFILALYVVIGLLALLPVWVAVEFEGDRQQAVELMWKSWAPGGLAGAAFGMFSASNSRRRRTRTSRGGITALGMMGYVFASQGPPRFLGAFLGFMSGFLVIFSLSYAVVSKRRRLRDS